MIAKIVSFVVIVAAVAGQPMDSLHGVDPNTLSCDPNGQESLLLPHFTDCNKFYMCAHGREVEFSCSSDALIFDFYQQTCNWKSQTTCILRTREEDIEEEGSGGWISDHHEPSILIEEELGEDEIVKFNSPVINCQDALSSGRQLPYHGDCQRYWRCESGVLKSTTCQDGLFFNALTQQCDFEANVKCAEQQEGELHGEYILYN